MFTSYIEIGLLYWWSLCFSTSVSLNVIIFINIKTIVEKYTLYTTNQGRNKRGRARATYVKLMEKVTGINNHALIQLSENREEWRKFVIGRTDTQTPD